MSVLFLLGGCETKHWLIDMDQTYNWKNTYPKMAIILFVRSPLAETFQHELAERLIGLGYRREDIILVIPESEQTAERDARNKGADLIIYPSVRLLHEGEKTEDKQEIVKQRDEPSVRTANESPYEFHFYSGVKITQVPEGKVIYHVRYDYNSRSRSLDIDRCLRYVLAPLANARQRGDWRSYRTILD